MTFGTFPTQDSRDFHGISRKRLAALIAAVIAVVLIVVVILFRMLRGPSGPAVYVQPVSGVNIAATSSQVGRFAGVVESAGSQKVAFDSERTLDKVSVKVGDHVAVGQVLFSYDTSSLKLTAEKSQIELDRLDQTITNSSEQIRQLQAQANNSSGDERLDALAQIGQLQADVAQAQYDKKTKEAELKRLQESIKDPTVKAEISGTIEKIDMNVAAGAGQSGAGEGEDGSASVGSGPGIQAYGAGEDSSFITILADGAFRIKTTANEQNLSMIKSGMDVIVRSRVDTNKTWNGKVGSIESKPQKSDENEPMMNGEGGGEASKYSFYVNLSTSLGLMLGQHVTVEPDQGQAGSLTGIWLDEGWIVKDGNQPFVWMTDHEGGSLIRRAVKLGEKNEELAAVQVLEGLSNSDFIAWPDENCKEGAATTTELVIPPIDEEGMGSDPAWGSMGSLDMGADPAWNGSGDTGSTDGMASGDRGSAISAEGGAK